MIQTVSLLILVIFLNQSVVLNNLVMTTMSHQPILLPANESVSAATSLEKFEVTQSHN